MGGDSPYRALVVRGRHMVRWFVDCRGILLWVVERIVKYVDSHKDPVGLGGVFCLKRQLV